jgi:hypothetical protein
LRVSANSLARGSLRFACLIVASGVIIGQSKLARELTRRDLISLDAGGLLAVCTVAQLVSRDADRHKALRGTKASPVVEQLDTEAFDQRFDRTLDRPAVGSESDDMIIRIARDGAP